MAVQTLWRLLLIAQAANACTAGDSDSSVCVPAGLEDVEEIEDVNDADMMVHLQTRAIVDLPLDHALNGLAQSKETRGVSRMQKGTSMTKAVVWEEEQESPKPTPHETFERSVPVQAQKSVPQQQSASNASVVEVLTFTQWWARSLPFVQIGVIIGIILGLFGVHRLAKNAGQSEVDKLEEQFDASAKLQRLLQKMRFEPQQIQVRKIPAIPEMQPAEQVKEGDSGNKAAAGEIIENDSTDEEPEAEQEEPEAEAAVDGAVCAIAQLAQHVSADSPQKPAMQCPQKDKIVEEHMPSGHWEEAAKGRFTVQVVSC